MNMIYPQLSMDAARSYESAVLEGDSSRTAAAMESAGTAIGMALLEDYLELSDWSESARIVILGGKGLNTGDALVACEAILNYLPRMQVCLVSTVEESELNPLAGEVLARVKASLGDAFQVISAADYLAGPPVPADVVIDGIHGLGFRPPLQAEVAGLLQHMNARRDVGCRVSIDLPSGLSAEGAEPQTFVADFTYIPGVAKRPCFENANARFTGRVRFLELDMFSDQPTGDCIHFVASSNAHKAINGIRPSSSDKRSYGHGLVLAGSAYMPGAAVMATRGALNAGIGLATVFTPGRFYHYIAGAVPEAMWCPVPLKTDGTLDPEAVRIISQHTDKATALLIGPGLQMDRSTSFVICRIVRENPLPAVLDASALTQDVMAAILGRSLEAGSVVLTPHAGEYARILGPKEDVSDPATLMSFCRKYRVIVVLKGHPTTVCDGHRIITISTGGPVLARGGSGDILSGMLLAQLGQHPSSPLEAVVSTVTWHGAAGDSLARQRGSIAVTTTDLLPHLSQALRS